MLETEMISLTSAQLRLEQARHFLSAFVCSCGPPRDSYFHMVANFDAFLFFLTSTEEMVGTPQRAVLQAEEAFRFMKALRNITTHHSILAASQSDAKFFRPFIRHLDECIGPTQSSSGRLVLVPDRLRAIFDAIECEVPREKKTLDLARHHLASLEVRGTTLYIEDVMREALASVQFAVA